MAAGWLILVRLQASAQWLQCFKLLDDTLGIADEDCPVISVDDAVKRLVDHIDQVLSLGIDHADEEARRVIGLIYKTCRESEEEGGLTPRAGAPLCLEGRSLGSCPERASVKLADSRLW